MVSLDRSPNIVMRCCRSRGSFPECVRRSRLSSLGCESRSLTLHRAMSSCVLSSCVGLAIGHSRMRAVAVRRSESEIRSPELVPTESGGRSCAASIALSLNGEWLVGDGAEQQAAKNPKGTVNVFGMEDTVDLNGTTVTKEEAFGMLFKQLKKSVDDFCGSSETIVAVLAVPPTDDKEKQMLRQAARASRIEIAQILDEHDAAMVAENYDEAEEDREVCVLDVGATRTRLSKYMCHRGMIYRVSRAQRDDISAFSFTEKLEEFSKNFLERRQKLCVEGQKANAKLRIACVRAAKILASGAAQADVEADALVDGVDVRIRVTRARFDDMCSSLSAELKNMVAGEEEIVYAGGYYANDELAAFGAAKQSALIVFGTDFNEPPAILQKKKIKSQRYKALLAATPTKHTSSPLHLNEKIIVPAFSKLPLKVTLDDVPEGSVVDDLKIQGNVAISIDEDSRVSVN